jgi:hypothetical protein
MASRDHPAKRVLSAMMPWHWHPTLVGFRRADVLGALPARRDGSRWNPVNDLWSSTWTPSTSVSWTN